MGEICFYSGIRLGHVMPIASPSTWQRSAEGSSSGMSFATAAAPYPSASGSTQLPLLVIDKFQLGGPLSIRGFGLNSLGPKDRGDPIGGDCSAELGIGCLFPLSRGTKDIVRGHVFGNAGVLTNLNRSIGCWQNFRNLLKTNSTPINASVGMGLQVCLGEAKLEFNIARPVSRERGAIFGRGIQVGVGIEFL
jgi:outer membrane protein insertion porin family